MKRILVVRNDKLGDFMLAWPALAWLKHVSQAHISVLVPAYTASIARLCPSVDDVIVDPGSKVGRGSYQALVKQIKALKFDAAIALFSNGRNAILLWQSGIPKRFAPATKWAQCLYTHRLRQRRSQSTQPEWVYNVDLVKFALTKLGYSASQISQANQVITPPYLHFAAVDLAQTRALVAQALNLNATHQWLIVHPGSGGSARNLVLAQYAQFIQAFMTRLQQNPYYHQHPMDVMVTAGPGETEAAQTLVKALVEKGISAAALATQTGLPDFARVIANGALFFASSTGPLHIAGALNVPTIGVFTARRSATALRWQPLNQSGQHWPISVPDDAVDPENLAAIDWVEQGKAASIWFQTRHTKV